MSRVFLSHSSEDKEWYVNSVYKKLVKKLGEESVVIDAAAFQEGRKTTEEILYHLNSTDLFVIFLSDEALKSTWVQDELTEVGRIITEKNNYQICPIIIDNKIKFDDERIPKWIRETHNIKNILVQTKAASIISQRMFEIAYEKNPKLKEKNQLFVGRNKYLNEFEERMDNFDLKKPIAIIASGIPTVGRRTFLKKALFKSNIEKDTYQFPSIILNGDESIEDCILLLYDLGFLVDESINLKKISPMMVEEKTKLLIKIIQGIQESNEIIIIIDNGCIINHEGNLADWFRNAIKSSDVRTKITFLIASKFRYYIQDHNMDQLYYIPLPELDVKERQGLLNRYLQVEEIFIDAEEKKQISELLSGYPEQVFFAVNIMKNHGLDSWGNYAHDIVDFNTKKAIIMLKDIKEDKEKIEFLALLSSFDCIEVRYVLEIVKDEQKYSSFINEFYFEGICEYVGTLREYIRVNDSIKDYLQRSEYKMPKEYLDALNNDVSDFVKNIDDDDYDIPRLLYNLKMSLKKGDKIEEKYLIPSIYLKTMNDFYFSGKNRDVVQFADRALLNSRYMDKRIVFEIRYLLCSALAKLRDTRFLTEVQHIEGADHNFLFGFYYRQIGKFDRALERINKSLDERENFSKAKREKVQIYIAMQDYGEALELARKNYSNYEDNPHHIQAYFACLIKSEKVQEKEKVLEKLIENIGRIGTEVANEMTLRFKAQYAAFIQGDYEEAIGLINKAIEINKSINYARLVKFDIAERFNDIDEMKTVTKFFYGSDLKQGYSNNIICMEALIMAKEGNIPNACDFFETNIKNYTDEAKKRFLSRLNTQLSHR
jgi:tetratricopeptide (TPR) repeat protein